MRCMHTDDWCVVLLHQTDCCSNSIPAISRIVEIRDLPGGASEDSVGWQWHRLGSVPRQDNPTLRADACAKLIAVASPPSQV